MIKLLILAACKSRKPLNYLFFFIGTAHINSYEQRHMEVLKYNIINIEEVKMCWSFSQGREIKLDMSNKVDMSMNSGCICYKMG